MGPLFGAIAPALALLATSAQTAPETAMPFKTTSEYITFCSDATLRTACYQGYEAALVKLIVSKSISDLCAPSQNGTLSDDAYQAAEASEIPRYVEWLQRHPKHMNQDFRTGLGYAIVAIYGCK
jgi:hypothetical protein